MNNPPDPKTKTPRTDELELRLRVSSKPSTTFRKEMRNHARALELENQSLTRRLAAINGQINVMANAVNGQRWEDYWNAESEIGKLIAGEYDHVIGANFHTYADLQRRLEEAEKPSINTSLRLFDLVRYSRAELHQDGLITDEEYAWLCGGPMAVSPKGGSPSRQRLEDYDELRAKLTALRTAAEGAEKALADINLKQPAILDIIQRNGFVFTDIGREPGNWQHLAFTIYTSLCEVNSTSDAALAALRAELENKQ